MKLSRADFKDIVAEAIRLTKGLTDEQRAALLKVGDTASAVGDNFDSKPDACPVGQAFGYPVEKAPCSPFRYPVALVDFAFNYDDELMDSYGCQPRRIEVEG